MTVSVPKVKIRAALGRQIPGDGTIYIDQSTKSPTIGECIYCGSTQNLSDEHTIPYSLFGVAKLKLASCKKCAVETQKLEQRLMRDTFGQAREYLNFPSRKSKKNGKWAGTRRVVDTRTKTTTEAPLSDGVVALYMAYPDYAPRALGGEHFQTRHGVRSMAFVCLNDVGTPLAGHYEEAWIKFNPTDIERCIAKIALCEAIRVVDLSIRDRNVARFIVEGKGDSSDFLGAEIVNSVTDTMHCVTHQKLERKDGEMVEHAWMTNVQIFSFLPTPSYRVILRPSTPR